MQTRNDLTVDDFFPEVTLADWMVPQDNQIVILLAFKRISSIVATRRDVKRDNIAGGSLGKVIGLGKAAYRTKDGNSTLWKDYNIKIGEYVIIPKNIGSNYIWIKHPTLNEEELLLVSMPDTNVKHVVTDPIKALKILSDIEV